MTAILHLINTWTFRNTMKTPLNVQLSTNLTHQSTLTCICEPTVSCQALKMIQLCFYLQCQEKFYVALEKQRWNSLPTWIHLSQRVFVSDMIENHFSYFAIRVPTQKCILSKFLRLCWTLLYSKLLSLTVHDWMKINSSDINVLEVNKHIRHIWRP